MSATTPLPYALELKGVRKQYGNRTVIPALDLVIRAGEIVALLGPNGAGKSTTVAMALGFVPPDSGTVRVAGLDVTQQRAAPRAAVAFVPENVQLYPLLSGLENLRYFAALADLRVSDGDLRAALAEAGVLPEAQERLAGTYSKGMRQKLGVAVALMRQCKLLLLDEPTSGLDPTATDDFYVRLRAVANHGVGVLLVTHDIPGAQDCADRIELMREGQLLEQYRREAFATTDLQARYRALTRSAA